MSWFKNQYRPELKLNVIKNDLFMKSFIFLYPG